MYNIIEKKKNGKSLYTVVYSYGGLSLPVCQSRNYQDCVEYIDKQPKTNKVYNEEESRKSMERAISWCVDNDISKGREPSLD